MQDRAAKGDERMSRWVAALLLSAGAGLATAAGSLFALFSPRESRRALAFAMGFAAGVMILVSACDLLPAALRALHTAGGARSGWAAFALVCLGMLCALGIEHLLPRMPSLAVAGDSAALARMGAVTAAAVTLHNLPEGIATFMAGYADLRLGIPVAVSIALHNIPEGVAVAAPLYFGTGSRKKAFWLSALSGLSEPLGALLAFTVLRPFLGPWLLGALFAWVAGIMLWLSFGGLLPAAAGTGRAGWGALGVLCGTALMQTALFLL